MIARLARMPKAQKAYPIKVESDISTSKFCATANHESLSHGKELRFTKHEELREDGHEE